MRISNGIRTLEDKTINATRTIKPKASWLLRKGAMTATVAVMLPISIVTGAVCGAVCGAVGGVIDTSSNNVAAGLKAIREV